MGSAGKKAEKYIKETTSTPEGAIKHNLTVGDPSGLHVLGESVGGGREKITKKWEGFWKRTLGIGGADAPDVPSAPKILSPEEMKAQAKIARENELIRRRGTQGRQSTIKAGSRGAGANLQTTFRQLGGL